MTPFTVAAYASIAGLVVACGYIALVLWWARDDDTDEE